MEKEQISTEELELKFRKICIAQQKNSEYQQLLLQALPLLKTEIESVQQKIRDVSNERKERTQSKDEKLSKPNYFQQPDGQIPPNVGDGNLSDKNLHTFETSKWNDTKDEALMSQYIQHVHARLIEVLLGGSIGDKYGEFNDEMSDIIRNGANPAYLENKAIQYGLQDTINWQTIQEDPKGLLKDKSPLDCSQRWYLWLRPSLKKGPWTPLEDNALLALRTKGEELKTISEHFNSQRTPFQCLVRYRQLTKKDDTKNKKWTKEEDRKLIDVVNAGTRNWERIAFQMNHRTTQQCIYRFKQTLDPSIVKGKWSPGEDLRLACAVKIYHDENGKDNQKQWIKIRKHIKGRTDTMCRERWKNLLDPKLNKNKWTKEESFKLIESTVKHGAGKWSKISEELYPRTDNQCKRQFELIESYYDEENFSDYDEDSDFEPVKKKQKLFIENNYEEETKEEKQKKKQVVAHDKVYVEVENGDNTNAKSLRIPLAKSSYITKRALNTIISDVNRHSEELNDLEVDTDFDKDNFRLLSTWFNSIFLAPMNDFLANRWWGWLA